ncbi:hypothetical protein [Desulfofundulus kuznetsovii]|uniref:hypothetical protein n=1 Tax=Desulfofundulus kuznetsovii TaxID=58135 RepID=UPI00059CE833
MLIVSGVAVKVKRPQMTNTPSVDSDFAAAKKRKTGRFNSCLTVSRIFLAVAIPLPEGTARYASSMDTGSICAANRA